MHQVKFQQPKPAETCQTIQTNQKVIRLIHNFRKHKFTMVPAIWRRYFCHAHTDIQYTILPSYGAVTPRAGTV